MTAEVLTFAGIIVTALASVAAAWLAGRANRTSHQVANGMTDRIETKLDVMGRDLRRHIDDKASHRRRWWR